GTTVVSDEVDVTVLTEVEAGLVGYWPVDAESGTVAMDTSGLAQDGQLLGSPATPMWIRGENDGGLRFDGSQSQAVVVPGSPLLDPSPAQDDFSILLWIRVAPGAEGSIISRGSSEVSARQFQLFLLDPNSDGVSDLTAVIGGETNDEPKRLGVRIDDNSWHHVALVHDATALTNRIVVDGVQVGVEVVSGTATQDVSLLIGARRVDADDTGIGFPLTGDLDDVRFYGQALTDVEIQQVIEDTRCSDDFCIPFFADDFETGDLSAWTQCVGNCP
ncbi:MAG: LamG domain-containing protein, partial [Acidobacteriota bacterium]